MASTRNKNTIGDYDLEQKAKNRQSDYLSYLPFNQPTQTHFPGNGLITGRFGPTELCNNSCDVESFLYGIGSTNLVTPKENPIAEIKKLDSLNIIDTLPVILPSPLIIEGNQRPRPC